MNSSNQGNYIRQQRLERRMSHRQLAICVGVSRMTIVRLEQKGVMKVGLVALLAKALGVPVAKLLS